MNASGRLIINALWDDEVRVWVATSDEVPGLATEADDMDHVLIEVSFDQIPDEVQRERCERLPTGFRLPLESVDDILERSADFKKILRDQVKGPACSVPDR